MRMSVVTTIVSNALFVVLLPVHVLRQAIYCSRAIVRFAISTIGFAISMLHYYTQEQKRIRLVRHRMTHAPTYEQFVRHATELDTLTSQDIWKRDNDGAGLYNAEQIEGYSTLMTIVTYNLPLCIYLSVCHGIRHQVAVLTVLTIPTCEMK